MSQRNLLLSIATAGLLLTSTGALAVEPAAEPIFGSQLMTEQERVEHRNAMRSARSDEERAAVRAQHHEQMLQRAQERGVTLPATPPEQRPMAGRRGGMGPGMNAGGQGQGRGQGQGAGRGRP